MSVIYGVPASPFVRKAMLAHAYKDVDFQLVMTNPSADDEVFRQASPFGKIPAYKTDSGTTFADSSVIVAYLEKAHQTNPLYPEDAEMLAKALWFEEFADTQLATACNAIYFQRIIGPKFFQQATDEARVEVILTELLPDAFNYLESVLTEQKWLINQTFSIADLAIGTFLINLEHTQDKIDPSTYPKIKEFYQRFRRLDFVSAQIEQEKAMLF